MPQSDPSTRLHDFSGDQRERRQYRRLEFQFPLWLLSDSQANAVIPGIGLEISGGGLQFLLERHIDGTFAVAFELRGRRIRAHVTPVQSIAFAHKGRPWQRYRAKFTGLLEADFDYILRVTEPVEPSAATMPGSAVADGPAVLRKAAAIQEKRRSVVVESYDLLPSAVQATIVERLVRLKRLATSVETRLGQLSAHYGGAQSATGGEIYHRFSIRTRLNGSAGAAVFNTEVLVRDDGGDIIIRN